MQIQSAEESVSPCSVSKKTHLNNKERLDTSDDFAGIEKLNIGVPARHQVYTTQQRASKLTQSRNSLVKGDNISNSQPRREKISLKSSIIQSNSDDNKSSTQAGSDVIEPIKRKQAKVVIITLEEDQISTNVKETEANQEPILK